MVGSHLPLATLMGNLQASALCVCQQTDHPVRVYRRDSAGSNPHNELRRHENDL